MTFDEVMHEPSELEILREKIDDFLYEISELGSNNGVGTQRQVCRYLLEYAREIGLQD